MTLVRGLRETWLVDTAERVEGDMASDTAKRVEGDMASWHC